MLRRQFVANCSFKCAGLNHSRTRQHALIVHVQIRELFRVGPQRIVKSPVQTKQVNVDNRVGAHRPRLLAKPFVGQRVSATSMVEASRTGRMQSSAINNIQEIARASALDVVDGQQSAAGKRLAR